MEIVRILEGKSSLRWEYDEEADVLYIAVGKPRKAVGVDIGEGGVVRFDDKKKEVVGLTVIGLHKPIISEDTFAQAQNILDHNRKGNHTRHRKRDYPLSGVVRCAVCQSPYNGVSNVKNHRTGEKRAYYRCSGRARHNIKCGNGDVRAEILEEQAFELLDVLFSAEEVSKERLRNLVADQYRDKATGETSRELERLQKTLQAIHQKQEKLTDVYLEGNITRDLFERKSQQLRKEEGEIRIKIERAELQLLEKEQSAEYIKKAEQIAKSSESVRENLHPVLRRELLKLIFKKLCEESKIMRC